MVHRPLSIPAARTHDTRTVAGGGGGRGGCCGSRPAGSGSSGMPGGPGGSRGMQWRAAPRSGGMRVADAVC